MRDVKNNQPTDERNYSETGFGSDDCQDQAKTFVLINCLDNSADGVIDMIKKIDSATQVQKTDGSYDIVVTLEVDIGDKIRKALHEIRASDTVSHSVILRPSPYMGGLG